MNKTARLLAERLDERADVVMKDRADRLELMNERVTVIIGDEARLAEIKIGAIFASDESRSWKLCGMVSKSSAETSWDLTIDATVAGTLFEVNRRRNLNLSTLFLLNLLLLLLDLAWSTSLSDTRNDDAITDEPLDQPVILTSAGSSIIHALQAQIVITILADAAVIVLVRNSLATSVAVDAEGATEVAEARNGWLTEIARSRSSARSGLCRDIRVVECTRHADDTGVL